eukprot:c46061_g1_i1.p1 GENE.c46061_g1_i1~~c46061_g1_i1.p1  ORF type:complete len:196 (+),score=29.05 c46061_g1_i1:34-588(+)
MKILCILLACAAVVCAKMLPPVAGDDADLFLDAPTSEKFDNPQAALKVSGYPYGLFIWKSASCSSSGGWAGLYGPMPWVHSSLNSTFSSAASVGVASTSTMLTNNPADWIASYAGPYGASYQYSLYWNPANNGFMPNGYTDAMLMTWMAPINTCMQVPVGQRYCMADASQSWCAAAWSISTASV